VNVAKSEGHYLKQIQRVEVHKDEVMKAPILAQNTGQIKKEISLNFFIPFKIIKDV